MEKLINTPGQTFYTATIETLLKNTVEIEENVAD